MAYLNPESLVTVLISMLCFDNTCFHFWLPLWSKLNQRYIKHFSSSFKFTFQNILIILPLFPVTMLIFFSINYIFMFFVLSFLPLMCYYFYYLNVGAETKEFPNCHVTATWNDFKLAISIISVVWCPDHWVLDRTSTSPFIQRCVIWKN